MPSKEETAYIERAREIHGSDEVQIDADAKISEADPESGAWVQAWVWVAAARPAY